MSLTITKKIVKAVMLCVALYVCETWSLNKDETQRLRVLEMWIWIKREIVSWKDKKTNEQVQSKKKKYNETISNRKKY